MGCIRLKRIYPLVTGCAILMPASGAFAALGDLHITALQTASPDSFSFVALADIPGSTAYFFTDNSYSGSAYSGSENSFTWTSPAAGIKRGTVVKASDGGGGNETVDLGTSSGGRLSGLSKDGDQIFIFQGSSTAGSAVYAVNGANASPGWIATGSSNANVSYLPSAFGLQNTVGNRDLSDFGNSSNYRYDGVKTFATVAEARTALGISSNWTRNNDPSVLTPDSTDFTNDSAISAPASSALGRVMLNATPSATITLTKTGATNTIYSATSTTGLNVTAADGVIAANNQSENITVQLAATTPGSGTTGSKTFTVTTENTAEFGGTNTGFNDADNSTTVTATVLTKRGTAGSTLTASTAALGRLMKGRSNVAYSTTSTVSTTGDDNNFTRVTVQGGATVFDGGASTGSSQSRSLSGTLAGTIAASGTLTSLSVASAEAGGVNDTGSYSGVSVGYTATLFDPVNLATYNHTPDVFHPDRGTMTVTGSVNSFDFTNLNVAGGSNAGSFKVNALAGAVQPRVPVYVLFDVEGSSADGGSASGTVTALVQALTAAGLQATSDRSLFGQVLGIYQYKADYDVVVRFDSNTFANANGQFDVEYDFSQAGIALTGAGSISNIGVVPEPGSIGLLVAGGMTLVMRRRRRAESK